MMSKKKKTLFEKYNHSETVKDALIPERGKFRKPTKCNCGNVDYTTLAYVTKKSIRVMDNLAKAVVSVEAKNKELETLYAGFLKTANELNEKLTNEVESLKDDWNMCDAACDAQCDEIKKLKKEITQLNKRLEVMKHVN